MIYALQGRKPNGLRRAMLCQICQQLADPGTPSYRIVVATRPAEYPYRLNAHRNPKTHRHCGAPNTLTPGEVLLRLKELKGTRDPTDDIGGHGCEIVRELTVCPTCAAAWRATHPPQRAPFCLQRE
jgi:hypothetical protein